MEEEIKKYRLETPINIGSLDSQWAFLKLMDGKIVKVVEKQGEYYLISQWNYDYPVFKVFGDWLEPIEDGPVSAEESADKYIGDKEFSKYSYRGYVKGFKAGETNDRRRTQPVINEMKLFNEEFEEFFAASDVGKWRIRFKKALQTLEKPNA
jgi:hypothetical protein